MANFFNGPALDLASLPKPNGVFAVARDSSGKASGCGAVLVAAQHGELKCMYVRSAHRGQGVAKQILAEFETAAARMGCQELLLETGPYQAEALAFYARQGDARRGPFGAYPEHPLSVFMGKALAPARTGAAPPPARHPQCGNAANPQSPPAARPPAKPGATHRSAPARPAPPPAGRWRG